MKFIFALLTLLPLTTFAQSEPSHDCGSATAGTVTYKYCIDRPSVNNSDDVMFYFHGLNADETEFSKNYDTAFLEKVAANGHAPTVISISFGPLWFLTDAATPIHPALHDLVVNTVIPQMEALLKNPVRQRLLMGESMGGFNAIQLLVKNSSLFTHAVLLCPAISTLSPWSTDAQLKHYANTHAGVSDAQLQLARQLAQTEFPTPDDWTAHNPLRLAQFLSPQTPPFFISGGTKDEWGFYQGQREFAFKAYDKHVSMQWFSIPNKGHCVQTDQSLAALVTFVTKVERQ